MDYEWRMLLARAGHPQDEGDEDRWQGYFQEIELEKFIRSYERSNELAIKTAHKYISDLGWEETKHLRRW